MNRRESLFIVCIFKAYKTELSIILFSKTFSNELAEPDIFIQIQLDYDNAPLPTKKRFQPRETKKRGEKIKELVSGLCRFQF